MRSDSTKTSFRARGRRFALCCLGLAVVVGCDVGGERAPAVAAPPPIDPPVPLSAQDRAAVTASFQCEGGHRIDIVREQVARIALADGRVALLESIQGSSPPTYTDNGLTVEVLADGSADLSDDAYSRQSCTPVAKPA
jgi:hypothetical protein